MNPSESPVVARVTLPGLGPAGADWTLALVIDAGGRERVVSLAEPIPTGVWHRIYADGSAETLNRSDAATVESQLTRNARDLVRRGQSLRLSDDDAAIVRDAIARGAAA